LVVAAEKIDQFMNGRVIDSINSDHSNGRTDDHVKELCCGPASQAARFPGCR